ncbi:hypothetical protein [Ruegeria sp. MALMAid1280]|uniref:hypothetical protein n=1 Tax=Ruegeria sp. MALMAid1280 TaxID=3411634 RepID=UPI003BA054E6
MAIAYHIYADLDIQTLKRRTEAAAKGTQNLWEGWWVNDDLGPFHEEVIEDYGDQKGYKTIMTSRYFKDRRVEARAGLIEFF